ncbi:hypothetical protein BIU98_16535 [Curtobacterium sp. MMLR14_010]|uniref:hypothetical protein n=1 Tax=Curtobacterium sp. MMLR14_010 TaxID=1898743 RepID=UPI0008DE65D3|nr:hypothetical protein [Curtobacterium sp. MMLR14_010]OII37392.1 hypothetical protein BIU98_16535 [Curtobacterium sp. MMLR14_010]
MSTKSVKAAMLGSGAVLALLLGGAPTTAMAAPNPPASTNATQGAQTTVRFSPGIPGRSANLIVDAPQSTRLVRVDDAACTTNPAGTQITCNRSQWVNPRTITLVVDQDAPLGADLTGGRVRFEDAGTLVAETPFGIHVIAKPLVASVATDVATRTATLSGTGQPGATVRVTGGADPVETEIPVTGSWTLTVRDLRTGSTPLTVTQSVAGVPDQQLERSATIPTVDPTIEATADPIARTVVLSGSGEPDAEIAVSGSAGTGSTAVQANGDWRLVLEDVPWGDHEVSAQQTFDSDEKTVSTKVSVTPIAVTADVASSDPQAGSAELTGTGHPRATIEVQGPSGAVTAEVSADGSWSARVQGLQAGRNVVPITQRVPGAAPTTIELDIVVADTPLMHPLAAGGAGVAVLAMISAAVLRRRELIG